MFSNNISEGFDQKFLDTKDIFKNGTNSGFGLNSGANGGANGDSNSGFQSNFNGIFGNKNNLGEKNSLGNSNVLNFGGFEPNATINNNLLITLNQAVQGGQVDLTSISKIGDLPMQMKEQIIRFDNYIESQYLIATTLQNDCYKQDNLIKSIPNDIKYLQNRLFSTRQALNFDSQLLTKLKTFNNDLEDDINKVMQLILHLSSPTSSYSPIRLNEYFVKKTNKFHESLNAYEKFSKEVLLIVSGLNDHSVDDSSSLAEIILVIKSQYNLFLELSDSMAQLHNEIMKFPK